MTGKRAAAGITLAAMTLTAACGASSSKGPTTTPASDLHGKALVLRVADAVDKASSAHVTGVVKNSSDDSDSDSADFTGHLDASMTRNAESGTISTPGSALIKLVFLGSAAYLYGNAAYWNSNFGGGDTADPADPVVAGKLANRWLSLGDGGESVSGSGSSLGGGSTQTQTQTQSSQSDKPGLSNLHQFATMLRHPDSAKQAKLDTVTTALIVGHQTYVLSQQDGSKLYVDQQTLLPVHLDEPASSQDGETSITFDDYNAHVSIVAPVGAISMSAVFNDLFTHDGSLTPTPSPTAG